MIKVGSKVTAIDECVMESYSIVPGDTKALIPGKTYVVEKVYQDEYDSFDITSEIGKHGFELQDIHILKEGETLKDYHLFEITEEEFNNGV